MNFNYLSKIIIIISISITFCLCDRHINNNFRSKSIITNKAESISTNSTFKRINNHNKLVLIRGGYRFDLNSIKLNLSLSTTKIILQVSTIQVIL